MNKYESNSKKEYREDKNFDEVRKCLQSLSEEEKENIRESIRENIESYLKDK